MSQPVTAVYGPEGLLAANTFGLQGQAQNIAQYDEELRSRAEEQTRKIKARMAPPGALKLPPLLEKRRLEFGMPDGMFRAEALFDRIFVWQPPDNAEETFVRDGRIVRPDAIRDRDQRATPRGILVGAGLVARDVLLHHGIPLGAVVRFIRLAPWSMEVDNIDGQVFDVLVMKVGDLTGCEDLREQFVSGAMGLGVTDEGKHRLLRRGAVPVAGERIDTDTPEDY